MRLDISQKLTHFTSGESHEAAFENLCNIIAQREIRGTSTRIRGDYPCVCFTEAPLASLPGGFVNSTAYSQYFPFGIVLDKRYLFDIGARPVIYGPPEEFQILPESMRWRHVKYAPTSSPAVDFTWEREWRLLTNTLRIGPEKTGIVVPNQRWGERIIAAHGRQQNWLIQEYSLILGSCISEQYKEDFPWKIYVMAHAAH